MSAGMVERMEPRGWRGRLGAGRRSAAGTAGRRLVIGTLAVLIAVPAAMPGGGIARAQEDPPQIVPVDGGSEIVATDWQAQAQAQLPPGAGAAPPVQDPGTGMWVDPNTGYVLDPASGQWVDPSGGTWVDPNAGTWEDPSMAAVDQTDGGWVDPAAGEWVDPNTVAAPVEEFYDPTSGESAPRPVPAAAESVLWTSPITGETFDLAAFQPGMAWPAGPNVPPGSVAPAALTWAPPRTVFIPATGQSVDGVFLDSWRAWGGALSWGNPITQEFTEDGRIVQYYDLGRFEYWPEGGADGAVVQFGALGAQTRPFMLRRGLPGDGEAASEAAQAARAWIPLDAEKVAADDAAWRFVPATGHGVADEIKAFWEATGEATYLGNPLSEAYEADGRVLQIFERGIVAQEVGGTPYLLPIGEMLVARYGLDTTSLGQGDLPIYDEALFEPPVSDVGGAPIADPSAPKRLRVSLSQQYAQAFQGEAVVWEGYVSTGRDEFATPAGTYQIISKVPVQTMEGVLGGEYYRVPWVPSVMYFTDRGHALHGTYWHSNFGTPMSHGCVNLPMEVADWMYQWAPMGMTVEVVP